MTDDDWNTGFARCLGVRLAGDLIGDENESGEPIVGETLLLLFNAHHEPIPFTLPATKVEHRWERVFDTAGPAGAAPPMCAGELYPLQGRSLAVLHIRTAEETGKAVSQAQVETLGKESQGMTQPGQRRSPDRGVGSASGGAATVPLVPEGGCYCSCRTGEGLRVPAQAAVILESPWG